jgi:hypothetical protein
MISAQLSLKPAFTEGAAVSPLMDGGWCLKIPKGKSGVYRLAQLDDYSKSFRRDFPWKPPLILSVTGRVSRADIAGTWGFGLWNDPFSLSLGVGGGVRRFPAVPNTAWFFSASPQNFLSFREDKPAQGFLAQTFRSKTKLPALAVGSPLIPLLAWPWAAKKIRKILSRVIREDSETIPCDVTHWKTYTLQWEKNRVLFKINGELVFRTSVSPIDPLGCVIWIDNQYASFPPSGRLTYGTLENPESAWMELKEIKMIKST